MPGPDASARLPWRSHWPAAVLALVAAAIAVWAHHHLFPAMSWNRDEPVYLWHVDLLRGGRLTAPDGGHPDGFLPWLSAAQDGRLFTQYTLGWPLTLLAAELLTGTAASALPFGAALAVVGVYAVSIELLGNRRVAVAAGALLVVSPMLAIQGGAYLSYLFTLGLGLLFGALLLSGIRRERWMRPVVAGLLLGWIFLTRPYDAVLWGLAFGGYALVAGWPAWRRLIPPVMWVGAAALPFVAAGLAYNAHVTGSPTEFPITVADRLDTFGFGTRRLMPGFPQVDYTITTGLRATVKNAGLLPWFLAGSYLTGALALLGAWRLRRDRAVLALVLVAAVFPLGYLVFWGAYLSSLAARISGPIYFVPLLAPICILAGSVLVTWWDTRRRVAIAVAVAIAAITVPLSANRFDVNRDISLQQRAWHDSVESVHEDTLVLVADGSNHLLYTNPFASNHAELDDRILYATMATPGVFDLIADHPDRDLLLQEPSVAPEELGPREDPYDLLVSLTPARVQRGSTLTLSVTLDPIDASTHAVVIVDTGAETRETTSILGGTGNRLEFPLASSRGSDSTLTLLERGTVTVSVGFGNDSRDARRSVVERQTVHYRVVEGRLEVLTPASALRLTRVKDRMEWRHQLRTDTVVVDVIAASSDS